MSMLKWAEEEVKLACEKEKSGGEEGFDYGCACYESALEAFKVLCKQGHSGLVLNLHEAY